MNIPLKTRSDLGWDRLLDELANRTRSVRGAVLAHALSPIDDLDSLRARHEEVGEARALRDVAAPLPLGGVREIDEALQRAAKAGTLDAQSLRDVASTVTTGRLVKRHLTAHAARARRLVGRAILLTELEEVSEPIENAFEEAEGAARIADRASTELGPLRRRALKVREELERRLSTMLDASNIVPHLQDRFFTQREDRFVLPIRIDARSQVRGIVHGTSQSGQTVFIEPEDVVDLNNRLKLAELEVADEERRILAALTGAVTDALPQILVNLDILSTLDLIDASAQLSADLRAEAPELSPQGEIDLRRARHPLMALGTPAKTIVPNDIRLGFAQALVISGPNAGGKTVALKTTGLLTLMARSGLHIPAQEGSRLPFFDAVLTDIGDDQSLERNLSTFSAHILQLRSFLDAARPGVLVLLDEVAGGTDPAEGAALAQAVLEELVKRGCTIVVTTHYDRLKALPPVDPRFINASVGFDVDRLSPTYELHLGMPGASGAITVARRLGLDEATCARSASLTGDKVGLEELLETLDAERKKMSDGLKELERAKQAAALAEEAATTDREQAAEELKQARRGAHDEAVDSLRKARLELDETRSVLRRRGKEVTPATFTATKEEIARAAERVAKSAPVPEAPAGRAATADDLKPGVEVFVTRLQKLARVLSAPKNGKLEVQMGALKSRVTVEDLRLPSRASAAVPMTAQKRRGHNAFDMPGPATPNTRGGVAILDVRGERVDVAVGMAEKFLDDALRSGNDAVHVIHGHGTGALREALRRELGAFPGVSGVRPATVEEGGDGTTVISLA